LPATSTVWGYAAHVRLLLESHLGPILSELTVGHVQAMFTAITRQHEVEGRPVTSATLARIRATPFARSQRGDRHGRPIHRRRTVTGLISEHRRAA
jgi:hypothetical protein